MPVNNVAITGPDNVPPIWPPAPRVAIMGIDPNGPNRQGGYQHDARFGTLQEQARGALLAHAQVTVEPPADMLDDLAAFQRTLFSSPAVEALAGAIESGATPFPIRIPSSPNSNSEAKRCSTARARSAMEACSIRAGRRLTRAFPGRFGRGITTSRRHARVRPPMGSNPVHLDSRVTLALIASRWPTARPGF